MHAIQKVDVRDIIDCDYKVIAQIVNMLLDPCNRFQKEAAQQVSPCKPLPFDILSINLYVSWVVSKLLELQCDWKVQNHPQGPHKETIHNLSP